ncbi:MAG TPA: N-acetyl-gamma-glutamyl-phosphate reductase [Geminicoccus sp.]|uniref:N-acetyl-gamma-glutamyl-phosphate reductase n=1 Tax=Geminicoccus sp. TaxID=2024832 RepID=UPI002E34787A|nr:N-acetyl-gamma-glutamyl-phosphate reductase [Geminicoccus sp.]HEX2525513.1 N-acetyl-gamma-glutamyl-phosphate reductase [Geminicoccus sp.]
MAASKLAVGVLGASGYTGAELLRLLGQHDGLRVEALTGDRMAGKEIAEVFPHLAPQKLPRLVKIEDVDFATLDIVFCCLPHGTTQEVLRDLPHNVKIVDLSADFRLYDPKAYQQVYGHPHKAIELQREAVYGLTEHYREKVKSTRLVANPGCYTTTSELPLIPLLAEELIERDPIVIDAKSGVSGAGRSVRENLLFTEIADSFAAYGVGNHRHAPEIDQCLGDFAGGTVKVSFTPHLVPMVRGIFATTYVRMKQGVLVQDLQERLEEAYQDEPFVHVLPMRSLPATKQVRGSNHCLIAVHPDRIEGRAILLSVSDNLIKGASGQALQNMNVMVGLPETAGLTIGPLFP